MPVINRHADRNAALYARSKAEPRLPYAALGRSFGVTATHAKQIVEREARRESYRGLPLSDFRNPDHPLQGHAHAHRTLWAIGIRHDEALLAWAGSLTKHDLLRKLFMEPNVGPVAGFEIVAHVLKIREAREG